jgi:hypothetical protein
MTTPDPDEMQERLDDLGDDIDATRRQAEEDGLLPDSTPEPTFIDPDGDGDDGEAPNAISGF